jgi:hypothetical protein
MPIASLSRLSPTCEILELRRTSTPSCSHALMKPRKLQASVAPNILLRRLASGSHAMQGIKAVARERPAERDKFNGVALSGQTCNKGANDQAK